jgi:hypothetical protein
LYIHHNIYYVMQNTISKEKDTPTANVFHHVGFLPIAGCVKWVYSAALTQGTTGNNYRKPGSVFPDTSIPCCLNDYAGTYAVALHLLYEWMNEWMVFCVTLLHWYDFTWQSRISVVILFFCSQYLFHWKMNNKWSTLYCWCVDAYVLWVDILLLSLC